MAWVLLALSVLALIVGSAWFGYNVALIRICKKADAMERNEAGYPVEAP